jgi:hypothetical protein
MINVYKILVDKPERKISLGNPTLRRGDKIIIGLE